MPGYFLIFPRRDNNNKEPATKFLYDSFAVKEG